MIIMTDLIKIKKEMERMGNTYIKMVIGTLDNGLMIKSNNIFIFKDFFYYQKSK